MIFLGHLEARHQTLEAISENLVSAFSLGPDDL